MAAAFLKRQWQVANNGGWSESVAFWSEAIGAPDLLTGYAAVLTLLRPGRPATETLTYATTDTPAYLTLAGNQLAIDIPRTVTLQWPPGVYDVQLRVFSGAADYDRYNLVGPKRLNLIEAPGQ